MAVPVNKGNLITRRSFTDELKEHPDRMRELHKLTGKAAPTCYQYTQEVGFYGSGSPSPLHVVIESVRRLYELDQKENCEISFARMFAEAPLVFLKQLQGEMPTDADALSKLSYLIKNGTDANYLLAGRALHDLPLGELREFAQFIANVATIAQELNMIIDARIEAIEGSYPGAPVQREHLRPTG